MNVKPAKISKVLPDSIAAEMGFEAGDAIAKINGEAPRDLIDYQFLCADEYLELEVVDQNSDRHYLEIEKEVDEDLGLEFETALFDGLMQCNNACPFCFIDQQPPGKRETLYLKDDDYRLSFLYGSYLTLTNLLPQEWERIARLRLSPLYVSVHATEPEVRSRLLKNPRAGRILEQLQWFRDRRLQIHAQVVVCPGINDGEHLERTLRDLAQFGGGDIPAVASVAVVPVGLTRFRPSEDELVPVKPAKAQEVVGQVQKLQSEFLADPEINSRFAWLADEWFLIAGEDLPPESHYEDYPQLGNGVGSIRLFLSEFETAAQNLPTRVETPRRLSWVVGNAVEKAFQPICQRLNQVEGLTVEMVALPSWYWGIDIAVTGLLTGQDLLRGLSGKDLGDAILLPSLLLKNDDTVFLDDMTVLEVACELKTHILPVSGIEDLLHQCVAFSGKEILEVSG
ncbi:TIGR03279 family radical SAM protein [Geitlerinema sp. PCC 9228]|jgi:putative radical SAM enzyme (TIGR03279 family)|uniref:TIGR03279 family radical SAM protein n=1 Tax=Geitlerinema sp. PCC 9228 TaxID=111611 RepID=UPI0008F9B065|nr:TIGR03279 family radical SAM protein [Geitlerinema sp. PCC 9228]